MRKEREERGRRTQPIRMRSRVLTETPCQKKLAVCGVGDAANPYSATPV